MSIGNSPTAITPTTTSTTTASSGNASPVGNDVFGANISGVSGTVTTSDYGAIQSARDIALSGLQTTQAANQAAAQTTQDALNKVQALGSQTSSGGLTTVLVPAIWIGGAALVAYFLFKRKG